ncbi:M48 family metallopeptidase [Planctomycetota bacterium]
MSGFFYNLGRKVGPKVRKAQWIWQSVTGSQTEAIKIENQVGRDLAQEVRKQLKPEQVPEIEQKITKIGSRLSACVVNKSRTFSFELVNGAEPNAFALPGGFIFMNLALVKLCDANTDEMAFILSHEMAHVIRGHAMNRIISNSAITAASRVVRTRGVISKWIQKAGVEFLESGYSQDMESEADKLGVHLMDAADYNPKASIDLLQRLANLVVPEKDLSLGNYFSTHPSFDERIRTIKNMFRD